MKVESDMKKYLLILLPLFLIAGSGFSQNNIGTTYGNHNDLNASKYQPSELDLGRKHVQLGFNYYLWMGNTTFDYKTTNDIYKTGKVNNNDINRLISKLHKRNTFGVGQDYQVLGLAFQLRTKSESRIDFGLSIVDKFGMSFKYTDNFMKLILKGNKQFAGQSVDLGPWTINAHYRREYVAGTAFNIFGNDKHGIRVGFRAKYLQGIGVLYMPKGNATMTTEKDGKYVQLDFDYELHTSGLKDFSFFNFNGKGYGFDAGVTWFINKNIEVVASVLDVGTINYTKNSTTYRKAGSAKYEGLVINQLFGGGTVNGDSLASIFEPEVIENSSFLVPLDAKICLEAEIKTKRTDDKDREYTNNAIFITYIQGLNNMPGATTRPFLSVGYNHDFHKFFDAGMMASMGGYNRYTFGAFFSMNIAHVVKLGFSSDNLMALIIPKYGTGIDFSTNFSLSF